MFHGSFTALITPFLNGKIDEKTYADLIERQIANGTHGVVPSGTTGESPTLNHEEHCRVTALCVEIVKGRIPVLAGTGSNSTSEAIMMTNHAQECGADGALIMTPYYNKPTQEGVFQHFHAIHNATDIPIVLYNIPGRCVVDMHDETIVRISELDRVIGIKDATGDLARVPALKKAGIADDFIMLSGDDETAVDFNKLGGHGAISVTANLLPKECALLQQACTDGDFAKAEEIQASIMALHSVLFCESSPQPAKYAAELMNLCTAEMRLPLVAPSETNKASIKAVLQQLELI
jgi:4-hydroxy-tetrahydrodipicolinate synthase